MTRARLDPLTPLPEAMIRIAREALEAGLAVEMRPHGLTTHELSYTLGVVAPDGVTHYHTWTCGPDGVWSRSLTPPRFKTRATITHCKEAR